MKEIVVRIIKSKDCTNCQSYLPRLDKQGYAYEVYDGDAPENQEELDKWGVEEFPVIQLISRDDTGTVQIEYQWPPGKMLAPRFIDVQKELIKRKYA